MTETTATRAPAPSPELVFQTLTAHHNSAALRAAIDLGLFTAVAEGRKTVPEIAAACKASERGIRVLCDTLTVLGFLAKQGGSYENSPTSAAFLDQRQPSYIGSMARFLHDPTIMGPWQDLTNIVRNGATSLPGQGSVDPNHPVWVEFAHSMAPMMGAIAGPLAKIVLADGAGPMRVLDIAAGHGLFGIEVARQNAEAQIVALDWAAVLEVARGNAAKAAVEKRYTALPGDAFQTGFQGAYDVVLLTNFLHHFNRETCVTLLKKVRAALKPGGRAATLEFVPNEDRISPPTPAMFAIVMLATTAQGDAYTYAELDEMHRAAGFTRTQLHEVPPTPHRVVTAYTK